MELVSYFEAVRHAQQVQVDEIPLPSAGTDARGFQGSMTSEIPLPNMPQPSVHMYPLHQHYLPQQHPLMNIPIPPSILKKTSAYASAITPGMTPNKDPPGVPPFPPPELSSDEDEPNDKVNKKRQNNNQGLVTVTSYVIKNMKEIIHFSETIFCFFKLFCKMKTMIYENKSVATGSENSIFQKH